MTTPKSIGIGRLPNGGLALVDERGVQIPAEKPVTTTAGDLSKLLAHGIRISIQDAAVAVAPSLAAGVKAAGTVAYRAGVKAAAALAVDAGVRYGARLGAKAGVDAGARYGAEQVIRNSRIRRRIERDEQGRITGSIEERVPE